MKLKHLFLTLFVVTLFFSCNTDAGLPGEVITVKLSPSFLQLSADADKPMLMKSASAADTAQAVYAIQVYENDSAYYYGVFDDVTKMQIALTTGKNYKFKVTALKTGTGKGLKSETATEGKYYYLPNKMLLSNRFIKGNALANIDLATSIKLNGVTKDYQEIDAFYSSKTVALIKGTTSIDFTLLRMGFGTTFSVDTLTTGKVLVFMGNDTITLTPQSKTATTVRLFNPAKANFSSIFNASNTYSDSIQVKAQWVSTSGTTVNTLGIFSFKRNYQKSINIQFNSSSLNLNIEGWDNIPTLGLVAWYPFNGNSNDISGNGNNGTANGALLSSNRFSTNNTSYLLSNSYIQIQNNSTLNPTKQLSVSAWVYLNKYINDQVIVSKGYTAAVEPFIQYSLKMGGSTTSNHLGSFQININGIRYTLESTIDIPLNQWVLITGTFDGTSMNLYLNSIVQTATSSYIGFTKQTSKVSISGTITTYNTALNFGRWEIGAPTQPQYLDGKIDDVGIWSRALTQAEVTALYNSK